MGSSPIWVVPQSFCSAALRCARGSPGLPRRLRARCEARLLSDPPGAENTFNGAALCWDRREGSPERSSAARGGDGCAPQQRPVRGEPARAVPEPFPSLTSPQVHAGPQPGASPARRGGGEALGAGVAAGLWRSPGLPSGCGWSRR